MKRTFVVFGTLMIAALSFTSCNKNLKDDIKDLKKQNSDMQDQLDGVAKMLGADEATTVTTTFTYNNALRTIKQTMGFKSADYYSSAMIKNSDNTYDIQIERYLDIWGYEGMKLEFNYNPATKTISEREVQHYWRDHGGYNSSVRYYEGNIDLGLTFNINIKSIDLTTGAISVDADINGTKEYSETVSSSSVPVRGTAVKTTFAFEGKLKVFERYEE